MLQALKQRPGILTSELSRLTGVSQSMCREIRRDAGLSIRQLESEAGADRPNLLDSLNGDERTLVSHSPTIRTAEELLKHVGIDAALWTIASCEVGKYDSFAKTGKPGEEVLHRVPLFRVAVKLKRKDPAAIGLRAAFEALIADAKTHAPEYPPIKRKNRGTDLLAEISVPDLHLGKLCWAAETGSDYDVKIAKKLYREAVEELLENARKAGVSKILLPVGNDFFNVDGKESATAGGTPQDEDGRWQRTFVEGRKLLVETIDRLREVAPVEVLIVPGNHDTERSFYLGETLACWYHRDKEVEINNAPTTRKYVLWGSVLLGFTHGNEEAEKNLLGIFATERPELWGKSVYREAHLGHWHHRKERVFQPVSEEVGFRVRYLSSLSAADAWHTTKGYAALRCAQMFLWSKTNGCVAEHVYNVARE